jgi:hypothetical protein
MDQGGQHTRGAEKWSLVVRVVEADLYLLELTGRGNAVLSVSSSTCEH